VTDANLVLGRLNADYFLGGALSVDVARAEAALQRDVATPLGLDLKAAARAVIDIANAKMVAALQFISIQRGLDPRDYTLVPSGGAGPMHAVAIAAALGVKTVLVPPTPGLNSALGLLATDVKHEFVRTQFTRTRRCTLETLDAVLGEMAATGRRLLGEERVPADRMEIIEEAELCYVGQSYPLRIRVPADRAGVFDHLEAAFHDLHRSLYGFASPGEATMIVNLRVTALGKVDRPALKAPGARRRRSGTGAEGPAQRRFRRLGRLPDLRARRLDAGDVVSGPAIIEQMDTTIVVPPRARALVDTSGCLVIEIQG
jgi:N-methylhydantoinase A